MRTFPPLQALRAFESAGRHLSFTRAAEELCITPSAVSHQVRSLEQFLGTPLFVRQTRALALTDAGLRYLADISRAFALIAEATGVVRHHRRRSLRISLLSSFAANWLVPRLPRFTTRQPDVFLQFEPSLALVDFRRSDIQLAVRYGRGGWVDVDAELLFRERLAPVCSPEYLQRLPLDSAAGLRSHVLLMATGKPEFEWNAWLDGSGVTVDALNTLMLSDYNIVLQAALDGQGVAMGRQALIEPHLRNRRLVQPLGPARRYGDLGYWIVTPRRPQSPAVAAFIDWLREEAAAPADA
ncbi:transcriptional regulator GcvA [Tahibacter amnicola]|uniref:Transcriptional regulator GcvA n=1 Tax=Tahibacter amnicola TaxID=2976241 RepID=A0ABY6BIX7_9GAMM|nr:transcriptional regulator GcvA [Tahibacter amnicola]UXI69968.1 transcriptional regulator GcvA [Tahibacter amnicola]